MDWRNKVIAVIGVLTVAVALWVTTITHAQSSTPPVSSRSIFVSVMVTPADLLVDVTGCPTTATAGSPYTCNIGVTGGVPPYKIAVGDATNPWPSGFSAAPSPSGFVIGGSFPAAGTVKLDMTICDSTHAACP